MSSVKYELRPISREKDALKRRWKVVVIICPGRAESTTTMAELP